MGIAGLLPFLEKSSKKTNISQFSGGTAAIDTYCWLHRGVFACAEKICLGQPTDAYVHYCIKYVKMLLSHNIKPILVFDGRHLPAKAETEVKRREARETNRRKAADLMRTGQHAEGRNLLRRSVDVTHEMALQVIKECQQINVDCIVAPYEADAQLAYLNISGIADVVITEDSDLTLFGCKKIFFKMDLNGNGTLVDHEKLYLSMDVNSEHFSMDDFRNMCILSGCDYLANLPGIGLGKARKFIKINTDCDIHRALTRLGSYLNMKSLVVTQEYRDAFILAIITFKHQLVFCPLKRQQVRLQPPTPDITEEQLSYAGVEVDPDIALQLAYGNCEPFTFKVLHNFDPDKIENQATKSNTWDGKTVDSHVSIWSKEYKVEENYFKESSSKKNFTVWSNTTGNEAIIYTKRISRPILVAQQHNIEAEQLNQKEILDAYEPKDTRDTENNAKVNILTPGEDKASPDFIRRGNPFSRQSTSNKTSPSLLTKSRSRMKGKNIMRFRRTVLNEETVTEINADVERSSSSMDIEEEHSASFISNECKDDGYSTISSSCDSGKSHLDASKSECVKHKSDISESNDSHNSLTKSESDVDADFLIEQGAIDASNKCIFKMSNTKVPTETNGKLNKNKRKGPGSSRTLVNKKAHMTNGTQGSQEICSVQTQQSLLSMFGFAKKKLS